MSEIYVGSTQNVYLDVYGGTVTDVSALLSDSDGVAVELPLTVQLEPADPQQPERIRHSAYINMSHTGMERELAIAWTFTVDGDISNIIHYYEVVAPYVTLSKIRETYPEISDKTDSELIALETRVRLVINSFTGQSFGFGRKTLEAESMDYNTLVLPERIIQLESFTANGIAVPLPGISIGPSFFSLESNTRHSPNKWASADPIRGTSFPMRFPKADRFMVTGVFGWKRVPSEITQAALLLIGDYSCDESSWRDRYIDNIRASDWRLEFAPGAFSGTGNVQADQLLSPYQKSNMVVV